MSFALAVLLLSFFQPIQAAPDRPQTPEPWYERVLDRINPEDTDYGAIWEERKRAFFDNYVRNPYFQYSFWITAGLMFSLLIHVVQHVSHQRALDVAARSISNLHRHDQYARRVARDAIRRYNDHIEECNRVIEASAVGPGQWVANADLESLKLELKKHRTDVAALREENKRLREDDAKRERGGMGGPRPASQDEAAATASAEDAAPSPTENDADSPHYVAMINKLQEELIAERRKNKQLKGTSV